jgi:peptide/nickel transport system ATP-binding protein
MHQTPKKKISFADSLALVCAIAILFAFLLMPWVETAPSAMSISFTGEELLSRALSGISTPISTIGLFLIPLVGLIVEGLIILSIIDTRTRTKIPGVLTISGIVGISSFIFYFIIVEDAFNLARPGFWVAFLATLGLLPQILLPRPGIITEAAYSIATDEERHVLLEVRDLRKHFPIKRGVLKSVVGNVRAVDGVNFTIHRGETLGLVGESGCGKTTAGRCVVRALEPTTGEILYHQENGSDVVDFAMLSHRELKAYRHEIQMIFQDPFSSLNPRMTVLDIVGEPLVIHTKKSSRKLKNEVADLLRKVGLRPEHMNRYPNAFSGGQRQRIGIARALALNPKLIVCDEPVSALDVSVQAQVVNLLQDLQSELGLTYLFIAHDLSVVQHISNRVAVMYLGKILELADSRDLYRKPLHPYTEALLSAVPSTNPDIQREKIVLAGDVPNPSNPPSGCAFHTRCRYAKDICNQQEPAWYQHEDGHGVACHFADELTLIGAK